MNPAAASAPFLRNDLRDTWLFPLFFSGTMSDIRF
jgi:hypothetical protein